MADRESEQSVDSEGVWYRIGRVLGVHPGEFVLVLCFFFYLLLVIASTIVFKTARDSLVLNSFGASILPYLYLASALVISPFISLYVRATQRIRQQQLIAATSLLMFGILLLFWELMALGWAWLNLIVYIWEGLFSVIVPMQFWLLAGLYFNTRQAKRLFGLIGAGGSLGAVLGGAFSSWAAIVIGTANLLFCIAVAMLVCTILTLLIAYSHHSVQESLLPDRRSRRAEAGLRKSLSAIRASSYLIFLAAIIAVTEFVTTIADYQFKLVARQSFSDVDKMTRFFGQVYGFFSLGAFLIQVGATGRILNRVGIGAAIMLLPFGLLTGSLALIVFQTLWAAVMLKGPDQLFRHSIEKATVELLYLPVPRRIKIVVKPFIDTIVSRFAVSTAGGILLLMGILGIAGLWQVAIFNIAAILSWISLAFLARDKYVNALRQAVYRQELEPDRIASEMQSRGLFRSMVAPLKDADCQEILYVFNLLQSVKRREMIVDSIAQFLDHPNCEVRVRTLQLLGNVKNRALIEKVRQMVNDREIAVQVEAMQFVIANAGVSLIEVDRYEQIADWDIQSIVSCFLRVTRDGKESFIVVRELLFEFIRNQDPHTRKEAARALGIIPAPSGLHNWLATLLEDDSPEVVNQALESARLVRKPELFPLIVDCLGDKRTRKAAADALAAYGEDVIETLQAYLLDEFVSFEVRRQIPAVISRSASQRAVDLLLDCLQVGQPEIRFAVIRALNKLRQHSAELLFPTGIIRQTLTEEIRSAYKLIILLNACRPEVNRFQPVNYEDPFEWALREQIRRNLERVSRLLGLIYPPDDLYATYQSFSSHSATVRANAMELLDNIFEGVDRRLVLTLIDEDVSMKERIKIASEIGIPSYPDSEAALAELLDSPLPSIKVVALEEVNAGNIKRLKSRVERLREHPNQIVRDLAIRVSADLVLKTSFSMSSRSMPDMRVELCRQNLLIPLGLTLQECEKQMDELSIVDRIKYLKHCNLFAHCSFEQLLKIAAISTEERFKPGAVIFKQGEPGDSIYCIVSGRVEVCVNTPDGRKTGVFTQNEAFGTLEMIDPQPRLLTARALEAVTTLKIDNDSFYTLLYDNPELSHGVLVHLAGLIRNYFQQVERRSVESLS